MAKPNKLNIIWGKNGVSVDPGDSKFELGWVAEIPPYQYFNYILNKHSSMLDHVNTYGIPEWDSLTAYKLGSRVLYNGILYRCTKATSTGALPTALVDWVSIDGEISNLQSQISSNDSDITTLQGRASSLESRSTALETKTPQSYKTTDNVTFNGVNTDNVTTKEKIINVSITPGSSSHVEPHGLNASNILSVSLVTRLAFISPPETYDAYRQLQTTFIFDTNNITSTPDGGYPSANVAEVTGVLYIKYRI